MDVASLSLGSIRSAKRRAKRDESNLLIDALRAANEMYLAFIRDQERVIHNLRIQTVERVEEIHVPQVQTLEVQVQTEEVDIEEPHIQSDIRHAEVPVPDALDMPLQPLVQLFWQAFYNGFVKVKFYNENDAEEAT